MCIYINTEYWPERSFKTLNLDMLTVFTFAPRYSGFNCIEHIWSSLSNKLAGITFSSVYPGDKEPPGKLSRLSQPKKPEKKVIFNKAMWSLVKGLGKTRVLILFQCILRLLDIMMIFYYVMIMTKQSRF